MAESSNEVKEMGEAAQTILHVDMDAFFASVAERDDPTLRGKAVVVGAGSRGVVLSANYAARKFGIRAAMPVGAAMRMAPHAIFLPPKHGRYSEVSKKVMEIFAKYTPFIEPISLDEAFLDVTGSRKLIGSGFKIGEMIRSEVFASEEITCSVGIASTKFIAKLASDYCKPNGILEVHDKEILDFLHPLPVNKIWGVGPKTNEELIRLGLRTVGELAHTPRQTLIRALGEAHGSHLYELAWGRDFRAVTPDEPDKSISAAETFPYDFEDQEQILKELLRLTQSATARLRERDLSARTIAIKVRFADFKTISRSKTMELPIDGIQECYEIAKKLYESLGLERARIRLIGISLENLVEAEDAAHQMVLGERARGWREATAALDQASARFGHGIVLPARLISSEDRSSKDRNSETTGVTGESDEVD